MIDIPQELQQELDDYVGNHSGMDDANRAKHTFFTALQKLFPPKSTRISRTTLIAELQKPEHNFKKIFDVSFKYGRNHTNSNAYKLLKKIIEFVIGSKITDEDMQEICGINQTPQNFGQNLRPLNEKFNKFSTMQLHRDKDARARVEHDIVIQLSAKNEPTNSQLTPIQWIQNQNPNKVDLQTYIKQVIKFNIDYLPYLLADLYKHTADRELLISAVADFADKLYEKNECHNKDHILQMILSTHHDLACAIVRKKPHLFFIIDLDIQPIIHQTLLDTQDECLEALHSYTQQLLEYTSKNEQEEKYRKELELTTRRKQQLTTNISRLINLNIFDNIVAIVKQYQSAAHTEIESIFLQELESRIKSSPPTSFDDFKSIVNKIIGQLKADKGIIAALHAFLPPLHLSENEIFSHLATDTVKNCLWDISQRLGDKEGIVFSEKSVAALENTILPSILNNNSSHSVLYQTLDGLGLRKKNHDKNTKSMIQDQQNFLNTATANMQAEGIFSPHGTMWILVYRNPPSQEKEKEEPEKERENEIQCRIDATKHTTLKQRWTKELTKYGLQNHQTFLANHAHAIIPVQEQIEQDLLTYLTYFVKRNLINNLYFNTIYGQVVEDLNQLVWKKFKEILQPNTNISQLNSALAQCKNELRATGYAKLIERCKNYKKDFLEPHLSRLPHIPTPYDEFHTDGNLVQFRYADNNNVYLYQLNELDEVQPTLGYTPATIIPTISNHNLDKFSQPCSYISLTTSSNKLDNQLKKLDQTNKERPGRELLFRHLPTIEDAYTTSLNTHRTLPDLRLKTEISLLNAMKKNILNFPLVLRHAILTQHEEAMRQYRKFLQTEPIENQYFHESAPGKALAKSLTKFKQKMAWNNYGWLREKELPFRELVSRVLFVLYVNNKHLDTAYSVTIQALANYLEVSLVSTQRVKPAARLNEYNQLLWNMSINTQHYTSEEITLRNALENVLTDKQPNKWATQIRVLFQPQHILQLHLHALNKALTKAYRAQQNGATSLTAENPTVVEALINFSVIGSPTNIDDAEMYVAANPIEIGITPPTSNTSTPVKSIEQG